MQAHLTEQGYPVTSETSPYRALDLLKVQPFALLITDLRMPEMHGMEVVRQAKVADPDLAIVVVTAMQEVGNAIDAMRAGADDYVVKPFNLSEIGIAARRALEKRTLVIQNRLYQEKLEQRIEEAASHLATLNAELMATKQHLESLLHSTVDAIVTTNPDNRIEFINEGALRMLGYKLDELTNVPVAQVYTGGEDEVGFIRRKLGESATVQDYETELVRKNGTTVPVNVSLSAVMAADTKVRSILAICKDITRQKQLEQELKELSVKDNLTGLYNQRCFYDRLQDEIDRARRQKHPLSMMLFDIDQFKSYNDGKGHLEGDRVLQTVGQVVMQSTREHVDLGFRYGGDEFTVILPEAGEEQALRIAERIRSGFVDKGFEQLTLSMGLMTYQQDLSLKSFIHLTDAMMYQAKRAGGNRICVYRPEEDQDETLDEVKENQRA
ncbi:MAG: diguanylate cyclase [Candidatus Hydrogenedentes bacterium]|nr:diguanylate cyclase [Candidatus Hydrogenedentota bacterium]